VTIQRSSRGLGEAQRLCCLPAALEVAGWQSAAQPTGSLCADGATGSAWAPRLTPARSGARWPLEPSCLAEGLH